MIKLTRPMKTPFAVVAALAMALVASPPVQAAGSGGHGGFGSGHYGGGAVHHGFDGHHFGEHRFDGRHFNGRFRFGFEPVFPYYGYYPPAYTYEAPSYWYYCPSYGAYYPNVASCPEAWVPVPAS